MRESTKRELERLQATEIAAEFDDQFEPETGRLVKVSYQGAFWHLLPGVLTELLQQLPDGAGADAVKQAIESKAHAVWHGPSPGGSRDAS